MASGRIRVAGYAQRVFYNNGIEYRNFSDSLVGQQFTEDGGNTLFTLGNFRITNNAERRASKVFNTNAFSGYYTLNDLKVTTAQSVSILPSTTELELNLDKTKITNYAFFGSFREFVRVSLEQILINWPASLYVTKYYSTTTGYTVQDYNWWPIENFSTFKIPVIHIENKFDINYTPTGSVSAQHTDLFDLRNFTVNYSDYVVSGESGEHTVLEFINSAGLDINNTFSEYETLAFSADPSYTTVTAVTTTPTNYHIDYLFNNISEYPDFQIELNNLITVPSGGTYTGDIFWYKPSTYYPYTFGVQLSAHTRISGTGTTGTTTGLTINYTATPYSTDYIYLKVDGNPFPSAVTGFTYPESYHVLPNKTKREEFFNLLPDFEDQLLNRMIIPKYTILFNYQQKIDSGVIVNTKKTITWPTSDNYNLDFDTSDYFRYVQTLINIADASDAVQTNLVSRFFVSESISSFDTVSTDNEEDETSLDNSDDQKIAKTLKIYGREFDEIKRYTDGLAFVHSISYDKKNNAPDGIIKLLANTVGWELAQSIVDNDILASYLTANTNNYTGHTVGLTPIQSEIEFWRRLIINSPWIWKSKGTRKTIEFLFKIIGTPKGLLKFNEYVYVAENPINIDLFYRILNSQGIISFDLDQSYIFKSTFRRDPIVSNAKKGIYPYIEYYHKPIDELNIDMLLASATDMGINLVRSTFNSNLFTYDTTTQQEVVDFRHLMDDYEILLENSTALDNYWVDQYGFPKALRNTSNMYFQKGGLWYRETGGPNAVVDILRGNNPHVGPYDRGYAYISNFEELVPDFTATTITNQIITTGTTNIFLNYNSGTFDNLSVPSATTIYTQLVDINNNSCDGITISASVIDNPFAVDKLTACGCVLANQDDALRIDFNCTPMTYPEKPTDPTCSDFSVDNGNVTFDEDGIAHFTFNSVDYYTDTPFYAATGLYLKECCSELNGTMITIDVPPDPKDGACYVGPNSNVLTSPCAHVKNYYDSNQGYYIFTLSDGIETYNVDDLPEPECCTGEPLFGAIDYVQSDKEQIKICKKAI